MKHLMASVSFDSIETDLSEIVSECRGNKYKSCLFHVYSAFSDKQRTQDVAYAIRKLFPDAYIVGCMSAGEIKDGRVMQEGILISALLFESSDVTVKRFDNIKNSVKCVGKQIEVCISNTQNLVSAELLFPGTSVDTQSLYEAIEAVPAGVSLFGGYPGGHMLNSEDHFVFDDCGIYYDAMFLIEYAGDNLYVNANKTVGWDAIGLPFKVTKSEGHRLIELDGRPAAEVYEKFLHIDRHLHNNAEDSFEFPLLIVKNDDVILRSTTHIEEDGSIILHGFVSDGMDIQLSYGNPTTIVKNVNARLRELCDFQPQAILIYSCVARKTFWENYANMEITPFQKIAPSGGFYTWGEVLCTSESSEVTENNITMLTIGMREGKKSSNKPEPVFVDDSVLSAQASLLKRLSRLVYSTMKDLQVAHNQLTEINRKLTVMAERDPLTGLYNRGKTESIINKELSSDKLKEHPLSLIMLDMDNFKHINDSYGHPEGDKVLVKLSAILEWFSNLNNAFTAGRWGGEEFFFIMPDTPIEKAVQYATRLIEKISKLSFGIIGHVSASAGLITVNERPEKMYMPYTKVDQALYQAKTSGKNRVCVATKD